MNNQSSFDLNQAIQRWRENLAQSPAFRAENLYELETHLRDAVENLIARGLSEEEAVLIAARRLGWAETLAREFGKLNGAVVWRDRALWMLAGMLFFVIGWDLSGVAASAIVYIGSFTEVGGLSLGWLGVAARGLTLGLVAGSFWLLATDRFSRWNPGSTWLRQHPIGCAGILAGGFIALKVAAGAFEMLLIRNLGAQAISQTYAVTMWFNALIPAFAVVAINVLFARLLADRRKKTRDVSVAAWMLVPFIVMLLASPAQAQDNSKPGTSVADAGADKKSNAILNDAMKLWSGGKKDGAMAQFLAMDFNRRPLFASGSVLNYTEAQFIALPPAAREKLREPMFADIRVLKEIGSHVRTAGKAALDAGDKATSELCTAKLQQCGGALDQPDSLALLKLVGKAFKKMASEPSDARKQ